MHSNFGKKRKDLGVISNVLNLREKSFPGEKTSRQRWGGICRWLGWQGRCIFSGKIKGPQSAASLENSNLYASISQGFFQWRTPFHFPLQHLTEHISRQAAQGRGQSAESGSRGSDSSLNSALFLLHDHIQVSYLAIRASAGTLCNIEVSSVFS